MRITNTQDFIIKANEIHCNQYDYSQTKYIKSSEKVTIICPIHGIFEQTPNKHLAGQGCKLCGRNRTKMTDIEFINKAVSVHGTKYDYSKVIYIGSKDKVEIVCRDHGSFYQTPHSHIILKQGCPKCGRVSGGSKRTGKNNVAHSDEVKQKKQKTYIERYGAKTWAESEEGRNKLHDIITSENVANKMIATCQERYGSDTWSQSEEGKQKLHEIMSSDEMQAKIKDGYMNAYGVSHYMKTYEGREKARISISSEERREKIRNSMYEKYGVYSFLESDVYKERLPEIRKKIQQTMLDKYGVEHAFQVKEFIDKAWATKRKNGTFNSSKPERTMKLLLEDVFGKDSIKVQYQSVDYPFHCDFYVEPLDLYIELNASWTHGGHWFDENNPDDIKQLNEFQQRAKQKGSRYYHAAIDTWTRRDLLKLQIAIDNNLNYLVFWKNDLSDFREWLMSQNLL